MLNFVPKSSCNQTPSSLAQGTLWNVRELYRWCNISRIWPMKNELLTIQHWVSCCSRFYVLHTNERVSKLSEYRFRGMCFSCRSWWWQAQLSQLVVTSSAVAVDSDKLSCRSWWWQAQLSQLVVTRSAVAAGGDKLSCRSWWWQAQLSQLVVTSSAVAAGDDKLLSKSVLLMTTARRTHTKSLSEFRPINSCRVDHDGSFQELIEGTWRGECN